MIKKIIEILNDEHQEIQESLEYIDLDLYRKTKLLVNNYNTLKETNGVYVSGIILQGYALSYTVEGKSVDKDRLEKCIEAIKENTSVFSSFRGQSTVNTAKVLANQINPKESLDEIIQIYEKLKSNKFSYGESSILVSAKMFENQHNMNVDTCIDKMKYVYESMRKNHPFLTSTDDYISAYMIATNSKDIDNKLERIEEIYTYLNNNGFYKGNTLQSLSHVLSFSKNQQDWERCIELKKALKNNGIKVAEAGYPIIGALALLNINDIDKIINEIEMVSNELKKHSGYGSFGIGEAYRNMIAISLVATKYKSKLNMDTMIIDKVIEDINQAINIAIMAASTSAILVTVTN